MEEKIMQKLRKHFAELESVKMQIMFRTSHLL